MLLEHFRMRFVLAKIMADDLLTLLDVHIAFFELKNAFGMRKAE